MSEKQFFPLERRGDALLSRPKFFGRLALNIMAAGVMVVVSMCVGMLGYHHFESMSWVDAYVNAAMILSGMGPMGELKTDGGKIFAGTYALYSGLTVVFVTGLILAPIAHRIIHKFNLEDEDDKASEKKPEGK